jgi:hypothetical protein
VRSRHNAHRPNLDVPSQFCPPVAPTAAPIATGAIQFAGEPFPLWSSALHGALVSACDIKEPEGTSVRHRLVVWGVIMDCVRTDLLLNFVAVDEFVWDEPHLWVVRVAAEEKFTTNHSVNH